MPFATETDGFSVRLDGKVAVVLGASAEKGSGWAIAEALARNGARVVVGARTMAPLQVLAGRIGGHAVRCDVAEEEQVRALARAALDLHGRLDIAVNAAGVPGMGLVREVTQAQLQKAMQVNLFGNFYFIKHMAAAIDENGSIIVMSSISTTHVMLPHAPYAAAKAGTDCLVRYAAVEFGHRNIRVNSILPGVIRTDMAQEALAIPGFEEAFLPNIPLGRIGEARDFANAVLFLAGPAYVTGTNWQYNGGNHLTRMPYLEEMPGGEAAYGSGKVLGDRAVT